LPLGGARPGFRGRAGPGFEQRRAARDGGGESGLESRDGKAERGRDGGEAGVARGGEFLGKGVTHCDRSGTAAPRGGIAGCLRSAAGALTMPATRVCPAPARSLSSRMAEDDSMVSRIGPRIALLGALVACAPAAAQVSAEPQFAAPRYASPQFAQPRYATPQFAAPQSAQPQYASPRYASPQYAQPQYATPQYATPRYAEPN
jgi:hypothetical protein